MPQVIFVNRLEQIRKELGFKTKRDFAKWLEIDETHYSRLSNQRIQPSLAELIYLRNQIIRLKPNIKLDDIIYEIP